MFTKIAVACFALYCVHGAQNTARDSAALAEKGANMAREATAEAPRAALGFCLENQALCAKALGAASPEEPASAKVAPRSVSVHTTDTYPLPPRRPAAHKKA